MTQNSPLDPSRMGPAALASAGGPAPSAGAQPGPAQQCRACSAPLKPGELFCQRCGVPQPGAPSCPLCGAIADSRPHPEMRYVCNNCGDPRVRIAIPGVELSGAEIGPLRQAKAAASSRTGWRVGGALAGVGGGFVLLMSLIVQLIFGFGLVGMISTAVVVVPLVIVALMSIGRAGARTSELRRAIDAAWFAAARDVASSAKRPMTARELARTMGLSEADSERLQAELAVDSLLDSEAGADGGLAFASRARIDTSEAAAQPPAPGLGLPAQAPATTASGSPVVAPGQTVPMSPGPLGMAGPSDGASAGTDLDAELEKMAAEHEASAANKARGGS